MTLRLLRTQIYHKICKKLQVYKPAIGAQLGHRFLYLPILFVKDTACVRAFPVCTVADGVRLARQTRCGAQIPILP